MDWIKFLEFVTKPMPAAVPFVLSVSSGFLLFAPDSALAKLGLTHTLLEHREFPRLQRHILPVICSADACVDCDAFNSLCRHRSTLFGFWLGTQVAVHTAKHPGFVTMGSVGRLPYRT